MRCAGAMGFALLFMAALGNGDAVAQPAQKTAAGDATQQAEALFREADAFVVKSQWPEAEAKLLAAWKLKPTYDLAANLGQVEYRLKKFRDAAEYLEFAVRTWPFSGKPAVKQLAVNRLEDVKKLVAVLRVEVSVPGAAVFVDGRNIGTSPIEHDLFVEPGPRTIEAKLAGYDDAKQVVNPNKGEPIKVELTLTSTRAGAAAPSRKETPPAAPPQNQERSWVPVIALGAASVVGLGVGIGMTVASNSASSDASALEAAILKDGPGCRNAPSTFTERCAELHRTGSRAGTFGDVALGSYVASGVLVLSAATYALWPRATAERSKAALLMPHVDTHGAGVVVAGAW